MRRVSKWSKSCSSIRKKEGLVKALNQLYTVVGPSLNEKKCG